MSSEWEDVSEWMDGDRVYSAKEEKEYSVEDDPFRLDVPSRPSILDCGIPERTVTYELLHNSFHYHTSPLLSENDTAASVARKKRKPRKKKPAKLSEKSEDQKPKKIFDILNADEDEWKDLLPDFAEKWNKPSYKFEDEDEEQRCRKFLQLSEKIWDDKQSFYGIFLTPHLKDMENCSKRLGNQLKFKIK